MKQTIIKMINGLGIVQIIRWVVMLKNETDTRLYDPKAMNLTRKELDDLIDNHKKSYLDSI